MKKDERYTKIVAIVLVIALIGIVFYFYLPDLLVLPSLSTTGLVRLNIEVDATGTDGVVIMTGGCYKVVATVERGQAISILDGMNDVVGVRPNVHDLFRDTLNALDAKMLMIKITDVKEDVYISKMIVRKGNTLLSLDARPSDAIAIAVRTNYHVPVYMNQTLLEKMGTKIC
ncbi:MAG: bifunctional nuclease family protein [Candidatus Aenigmatarchaeota archaeon]